MGKRRPLRERPKRERWFSKKQHEMLRRCSDKKDVTEWNEWRQKHFSMPVFLEGADLSDAHLEGADLRFAHLERADLMGVHLEGAHLDRARLESALLPEAHLEGAVLRGAHLEYAFLFRAHLEGADLSDAHLQATGLVMTHVDTGTLIWKCHIDRYTGAYGVSLDTARVDPGSKQLLEYNNRCAGWRSWYRQHRLAQWPVKLFWSMSDYGRSTGRVLAWFFSLAVLFGIVYQLWSVVRPPGIVSNLLAHDGLSVPRWLLPFRALYFSIVTMTTLGLGDMYAHLASFWGHVLLTVQVLLGYVLLGALVTRFAVLFTAGGPAAKFADERSVLSRLWSCVRVYWLTDPLAERLREEARKFQQRSRG